MNRRAFVVAGVAALATSRATDALESQPAKVYRLGLLTPAARPAPSVPVLSNMLPGSLSQSQYVEGQNLEPTMAAKRLELIKEAVPRAGRIAILTTDEPPSRTQVQWAERAASALGVKLLVVEVRDGDYDRAFAAMTAGRAEALCQVTSVILATDEQRIIELAAKHRLPTIYDWREHVEAGGLIAYGGSAAEFARRAAVYVDRIFKGATPATLPIGRAKTFELAINLRAAKALKLTIPASLRTQADHLIE